MYYQLVQTILIQRIWKYLLVMYAISSVRIALPDLSSKWYEEIKQYGAYPTSTQFNGFDSLRDLNRMPIPNREENPYVDAFWKWWPDLYESLHTLRLTGGEPLMSKDCWKVLEAIAENPKEI